jgi:hypothetical protein
MAARRRDNSGSVATGGSIWRSLTTGGVEKEAYHSKTLSKSCVITLRTLCGQPAPFETVAPAMQSLKSLENKKAVFRNGNCLCTRAFEHERSSRRKEKGVLRRWHNVNPLWMIKVMNLACHVSAVATH